MSTANASVTRSSDYRPASLVDKGRRMQFTLNEPQVRGLRAHFRREDVNSFGTPMPVFAEQVAARIDRASTERRRKHLHFLAALSRQPDEARAFARSMLEHFRSTHLGTPTMHRLGNSPTAEYTGDDFDAICDELDFHPLGSREIILGEIKALKTQISSATLDLWTEEAGNWLTPARRREVQDKIRGLECAIERMQAKLDPSQRRAPASTFVAECEKQFKSLPTLFYDFVVRRDPNDSWDLPCFRDFEDALDVAIQAREATILARIPLTTTNEAVIDSIRQAKRHGHMVWVAGDERIGKTTGAEAYAKARPDLVKLVPLVADSDDRVFYETFAAGVGCSIEHAEKLGSLKRKIVTALRNADQVLVIDEAHALFGAGQRPTAKRADWLRTALLNLRVPTVLIFTGMQFADRLNELRKRSEWNCRQFEGRRGAFYWVDEPSWDEMLTVARHYLPTASEAGVEIAVAASWHQQHRLPALIRIANEAAEKAREAGVADPSDEHLKHAAGIVLGTENLIQRHGLGDPETPRKKRTSAPAMPSPQVDEEEPAEAPASEPLPARSRTTSEPVQTGFNRIARTVQRGLETAATAPG